jgi:hypothetical protein
MFVSVGKSKNASLLNAFTSIKSSSRVIPRPPVPVLSQLNPVYAPVPLLEEQF